MIVFYEYMEQPRFWIAHDEFGYWLVPVKYAGWEERSPFVGRVMGLTEVGNQSEITFVCSSSEV